MKKKCRICNESKTLDQFTKESKARDGKRNYCKPCAKSLRSKYYLENSRSEAEDARIWRKKNPERRLLINTKSRAKQHGLVFDLTIDDIVIPEYCPVLGIPLKNGTSSHSEHSPTVDRIDPNKGYTKENVAVISYRANRIKNNGSAEEHDKISIWMRNKCQ